MSDYKWKFARIGGVTRVYISSAEDIKHLGELDKKMWTVLSCPVKGLEIDEQSLAYMDTNGDGQIRVDEVIGVSQWLCKVLKDLQPVVEGKDVLPLSAINQEDEEGKKIYDVAADILSQLGKETAEISLADSKGCLDAYRKAKFEAALEAAKKEAEVAAPYGDKTADIDAADGASLDVDPDDVGFDAQMADSEGLSVYSILRRIKIPGVVVGSALDGTVNALMTLRIGYITRTYLQQGEQALTGIRNKRVAKLQAMKDALVTVPAIIASGSAVVGKKTSNLIIKLISRSSLKEG